MGSITRDITSRVFKVSERPLQNDSFRSGAECLPWHILELTKLRIKSRLRLKIWYHNLSGVSERSYMFTVSDIFTDRKSCIYVGEIQTIEFLNLVTSYKEYSSIYPSLETLVNFKKLKDFSFHFQKSMHCMEVRVNNDGF